MDCIRPFIGILTCLWPSCVTHDYYLDKLQEKEDSLVKAQKKLMYVRDDVQQLVEYAEANLNEPMRRTYQVNQWLESVTATEGEVLEILLQVDQQISRRCLGGCCPNCWSNYMVESSIVQYIAYLDELRVKGRFEEVVYKLPLPAFATVMGMESRYFFETGMESMFYKVWRLLVLDEVRIMGLYGYGGIGKTTLLKQINNEFFKSPTTTNGFDVVILVVVSKVINIDAIQKEIGNRLGLSSPDKRSILNVLTMKSFVLLLDDIWESFDLESIGVPPPSENNKSKVVFTTRSENVCGLMEANVILEVKCLPWNEAWSLFVGEKVLKSFPRACDKLAEVVVRECNGLPLALVTIGRAMSMKKSPQEWNHAITTLRRYTSEFSGMGVLPILKVCYDNLLNDMIKSCFLYCALFPEDHSIYIPKLIDYWIGEGFISLNEFDHIDEARNHGYDVIGNLKGASLLESGKYEEETEVKMHDMIRELALWIAHECGNKRDKMLIIKTSDLTAKRSWYNTERIYLIPPPGKTKVRPPPPPPPLKSRNLITLINHFRYKTAYTDLSVLPQNFFEFTPLLRVLDLSGTKMETFPTSITELLELRYLSLSRTRIPVLPDELGKLVKLNFLDLSYMRYLEKIPSGVIGILLELRVLNLFGSRPVDWDIEEVYKLKHLNDLGITINTQPNLNKLLSNQNLERIPEANIGIKQHLGSSCFQNLIRIEIRNCNGLKDLTWVGYVPNLKKLYVSYCDELEEIVIVIIDDLGGSKGGGGNEIIFKSLKTLEMRSLPKLKSICRNALAFPCLESMKVSKCPRLKKLPFDFGSNPNNTLQKIEGERKWWTELQWKEEEVDDDDDNEEEEEEEEEVDDDDDNEEEVDDDDDNEEEEDHNNNNELLKSKLLPYFREYSFYD